VYLAGGKSAAGDFTAQEHIPMGRARRGGAWVDKEIPFCMEGLNTFWRSTSEGR